MQYALQAKSPGGLRSVVSLPESGQIAIGRLAPADLVIDDPFLSRAQYTLNCNHGSFSLSDAGSTNGTLVNGLRLRQSPLRHGDAVCAGQSFFRLTALVEDAPAAPVLAGPCDHLSAAHLQLATIIRDIYSFALLDGAREPAVLELLKMGGAFFQSLYEGEQGLALAPFGPFLVDLATAPDLLSHLIARGWGNSWGMYVRTAQAFQELRHHLRTLLLVDVEGEQAIFRFYDPRVLPIVLAVSTSAQRAEIFGEIEEFAVEASEGAEILILSQPGQKLRKLSGN